MRVRGRALAVTSVMVLVFAGCLSPGGEPDLPDPGDELEFAVDWFSRALPNDEAHHHYDRAHHRNLTTPNFRVVGHEPLVTDHHEVNSGGNFCGDVADTGDRVLAVTHSFTSDVAFVIFDVTDPAAPFMVGELVMQNTHVWDLAITPDQRYVVLATSQNGHQDEESLPGPAGAPGFFYRDACTGESRRIVEPAAMLAYPSGVVLVDVQDPEAPIVQDYRPHPVLGGHSIVAQEIGGETMVLVTVSNVGRIDHYAFYGILDTPAGGKLDLYAVHQTQDSPEEVVAELENVYWMNHDAYLHEHPVTGEAIAYLADGHWGVTILNVDDPRMPRVIARWNDAGSIANPQDLHFAHSILPIEGTWDGRHYTFFSEECTGRQGETPTCLAYVLDTTDPTQPMLAGAWTLPHDMGVWAYPSFSPHYMALVNRTLFISSWHAGLWAVDVSTNETLRTMPSIGVFIPEVEVDHVQEGNYGYQYNQKPVVPDVVAYGDHLIAFDGTSGAWILSFDASRPAPAPEPWPLALP